MMREPAVRRDQREIAIPSDSRPPAHRRVPADRTKRSAWRAGFAALRAGAGLCRRHPGEVVGGLLAMAAAGAIAFNALGFQGGRHPAPIFANLTSRAAPVALPPKIGTDKAEPTAVAAEGTPEGRPPRASGRDSIGEVIRSADPAKSGASKSTESKSGDSKPGDTTASVTPKTEDAVAKAQRALIKLGYGPLRADGILGAGTRAAIAKFERDRKLPVKGEPTGRTLRELATRAGQSPG